MAEDEVLIRMDLAEMLTEEGYDVVGQAGDGATAVELAEQHRPDLVILDVKMPVLDGIAAAEQIAGQRIAPVVILTAFSQRELVERARDAGRDGLPGQAVHPGRPGARDRDGGEPVRRAGACSRPRSPTSPSGSRPARPSSAPRACCMEQLDLSEPEAFRWIQKTAMDLRLSMRQVADGVVEHGPGIAGSLTVDPVDVAVTVRADFRRRPARRGGAIAGPTPRLPGSIRPGAGEEDLLDVSNQRP